MQIDQQIDWYDFVVVEKIELYDDEEMKMIVDAEKEEAKGSLEQVQRHIIQQIEENEQLINMPMQDHPMTKPEPSEIIISTALDSEMKIKKNYQRSEEEKRGT